MNGIIRAGERADDPDESFTPEYMLILCLLLLIDVSCCQRKTRTSGL